MPIALPKETRQKLIASIRRYFEENLEEEIGDLKASLLLDFVLAEIGPSLYNQAIADAQAFLQDKLIDLDSSLYQPELGYWDRDSGDHGPAR